MTMTSAYGLKLWGPVLPIYANLVRAFGTYETAALVAHLNDSLLPTQTWLGIRLPDLEQQLCMHRRQLSSAREQLRDLGILFEQLKGAPPVLYMRIDREALDVFLLRQLEQDAPKTRATT